MKTDTQWLREEKYGGIENEAFHDDVLLLQRGTPLAYLIGSIPFLDTTIYLDSLPLIPRTETEYWVEKAIVEIKNNSGLTSIINVLDLCAGSGAIGVAVAKAIQNVQVTFGEIDTNHIPTILKNIKYNVRTPFDISKGVLQSDLFEKIGGTYDFILTNPPYIDPIIDRAEPSVKLHEPSLALYGGDGGLEYIQKIIEQSLSHLTYSGQLWIEHEPEQSTNVQRLAETNGFSCHTHTDQYNVKRYSILVLQ